MTILREAFELVDLSDIAASEHVTPPIHPGIILNEEFMIPLDISARALARDIGVPPNRITAIINGTRGITAETAVLLGKRFGTSGRFWMNLQVSHDLALAERHLMETA
jgi:addiction module HigA family antidote